MSELRWDPLKEHWVIIATERGRRPRIEASTQRSPTIPSAGSFGP